jgi:type III restriction enzyme
MKLKFIDQPFQNEAVNAVIDVFKGTSKKNSIFTIDVSQGLRTSDLVSVFEQTTSGIDRFQGFGNKLDLSPNELLTNIQEVQERNNILKSTYTSHKDYAVEMETGTGKTYVYTKTIIELHEKYGFTKFIIVVPSIAIKEGVFQSFRATKEHFKNRYQNVVYRYFLYDSSNLNEIHTFATSTNIEVMIINIDSFKKSFVDKEKESKANIIHRPSDALSGNKPIDLIASTNPIVIIDEPQSVLTGKGKEAIESLKPLCTIRYSATHRKSDSASQHLLYRLTPVDAYNKKLVKQIEVASIQDSNSVNAFIKVNKIFSKKGIKASIDIFKLNKNGVAIKTTVEVGQNSDLYEISGYLTQYQSNQYRVTEISYDDDPKERYIKFGQSISLMEGEIFGADNENQLKKAMIKATIRSHLEQEKKLIDKGIKVLSLFFIDRVHNYRENENGQAKKGPYALWFEEAYQELIEGEFKNLKEKFKNKIEFDVNKVHDGYFSQDKKGILKDTTGDTTDDESTYEKIMQNKERLLDFSEPLRFIFSHSALKEGWDNPNIFQICTLVETKDTMTKRQKIGRGLRLCVDQTGARNLEEKNNVLRVIANESYAEFASTLQTELEEELGYRIGYVEPLSFLGITYKPSTIYETQPIKLSQDDSVKIFENLKANNYINSSGKVQEKFYLDLKHTKAITLREEYKDVACANKIIEKIQELSRELGIRNANERVRINSNKNLLLGDDFKEFWNKIQTKTVYSIDIDLEKFTKDCITRIKLMPEVKRNEFIVEYWRIKMPEKVSEINRMLKEGEGRNSYTIEFKNQNYVYPDIFRRLIDATGLKRQTIIHIIKESQRFDDYTFNPEEFITQVSKIINDTKKQFMTESIKYEKSSEYYSASEVFDDEDLFAYDKNTLVPVNQSKTLFDRIIVDSIVEKEFAREADADERVVLYAKLPSRFVIQTPWGTYNPDWMLLMKDDKNNKKLYFVTETKGTLDENERSNQQNAKILCGRKHFEVVDNELKYLVAVKLGDLQK